MNFKNDIMVFSNSLQLQEKTNRNEKRRGQAVNDRRNLEGLRKFDACNIKLFSYTLLMSEYK